MGLKKINKFEKAVVMILNLDGWDLKHTGEGYTKWDAEGFTPEKNGKRSRCVIEMKFRNKYYEDKKYCPDTTMWTKKRLLKDVYLLTENDAVIINLNEK